MSAAGVLGLACGDSEGGSSSSSSSGGSGSIKVGILHSLSGTMSISEVSVKDAELLAIEEINAAGGVLGKKIEPVIEDGASDWPTFAEKAKKLIQRTRWRWCSAAGPRPAARRCCRCSRRQGAALLPGPVRGPGVLAQHLLHRRDHQPADRPQRRVPAEGGQEEVLPARLRLRLPAHGQQDHQGAARGQRRHHGGGGVHARLATPTTAP